MEGERRKGERERETEREREKERKKEMWIDTIVFRLIGFERNQQ